MKLAQSLKLTLIATAGCLALSACIPPDEPGIVIPPSQPIDLASIKLPADVAQSCVLENDTLPPDWIKLKVPNITKAVGPVYDPNNGLVYVFPPNSPSFTPSSSNTNCSFFKWSAQMFNWLTSSVSDKGLQTPSVPTAATPFVFNSEFFYRVIPNSESARRQQYPLALTAQKSGGGPQHASVLRSQKPTRPELADGVDQAGGSGIVLSPHYDPNATGSELEKSFNESLVYFSGHVNRTYGYFVNQKHGVKGISFPSTPTETCATLQTAQSDGYIGKDPLSDYFLYTYCNIGNEPELETVEEELGLAILEGNVIPKLEPVVDYLSMAVELKSSWVDTKIIPSQSLHRYIVQENIVPHYKHDGEKWVQDGERTKQVALTGMHVVGTVKDHPEMIWATYEHMDNAPNAEYAYKTQSGTIATASDFSSEKNARKWLLSNTSDSANAPFNVERACLTDGNTITAYKGTATDFSCKSTNGKTEVIGSTNVVRTAPWGNAPVTSPPPTSTNSTIDDNTRLISLNRSVQSSIKSNNKDDPRQYYFLSGAVWGQPNAIPFFPNTGSLSPTELVGTRLISNSTMETFHQATNSTDTVAGFGCFSCHAADLVKVIESEVVQGGNAEDNPAAAEKEVINGVSVSHLFGKLDPNVPK